MKLDQFKKAAKRLAIQESIPLNEAQTKLSAYFNFKNFDAAIKALTPPVVLGSQPAATSARGGKFWCDLSLQEFRLLAYFLQEKNSPIEMRVSESGQWAAKGIDLFEAVIQGLVLYHSDRLLDSIGLSRAFDLREIQKDYISAWVEFKKNDESAPWPKNIRKLAHYIEIGIPGYRIDKLLSSFCELTGKEQTSPKTMQDGFVTDQHSHRVTQIYKTFLNDLEALEDHGGAGKLRFWYEFSPLAVPSKDADFYRDGVSMKEMLQYLCMKRRLPTKPEVKAFITSMDIREKCEIFES